MISPRSLAALFGVLVLVAKAETPPQLELRGMLSTGNERRFALAAPGGDTAWVSIGDNFAGWKLTDYHPAEDVLVLTKNGQSANVHLSGSVIGTSTSDNTKATLADAEEVLNKMKFNQMMDRIMEQQKKAAANMVKQLAAQTGGAGNSEDLQAFQARLMDTMFAELNADAMRPDIAKAYSEVFTKEELQAQAAFYSTPVGQAMVDKTPDLQQKMTEIMTPRIMAAMPKVQQMTKDFATEQTAKKQAAAGGAAP